MNQSVTPSGVEHKVGRFAVLTDGEVNQSVTPSGVEHNPPFEQGADAKHVNQSVTPSGVEHSIWLASLTPTASEPISDAFGR